MRDPATFIAVTRPDVVYVTHKNGAHLTITQPRVSGDSLHGTWQAVSELLALPLGQLQRIDAAQRDKTRTTMLIAGASVITVGMLYLLTRGTSKVQQPCSFDGGHDAGGCDVFRPPAGDG
ncbi:MAG TPA: hypothetical protein VGA20_08335 [Gemmatimonadales bacterium]